MKIKDIEYKFNPYRAAAGGQYTLSFNKKETLEALEKMKSKLIELKNKYPSLKNLDLNLYGTRAYLCWNRDYDKEERQKIKEHVKKEKEKWKKTHIRDVKKEAKKLGII
jgi:hypothetical protein